MKMSALLGERYREKPADAGLCSHIFLLRGGYVRQVAAGVFSLLPPAVRIQRKLEAIIRREMDAMGGQEVLFPVVMPAELWEESGRYAAIGPELLRFCDRTGHRMLLGMTHEEAAVHLARGEAHTQGDFPFMLYQIQTKFRDEPRARGGLIRVREFTMKDAYSFHTSHADLKAFYGRMLDAYRRIFEAAGLRDVRAIESACGMMGGGTAHEFMFLSEAGEDTVLTCGMCGACLNAEVAPDGRCPHCGGAMSAARGIEVGNIFQLSDRYTKSMSMRYAASDGTRQTPVMGCYGIGIGRLLACLIEDNHDARGPIWPKAAAPWQVHLCALGGGEAVRAQAQSLYEHLSGQFETLYDDRGLPAGAQFADADLLGAPVRVILSPRRVAAGEAELVTRDGAHEAVVPLGDAPQAVRKLLETCR